MHTPKPASSGNSTRVSGAVRSRYHALILATQDVGYREGDYDHYQHSPAIQQHTACWPRSLERPAGGIVVDRASGQRRIVNFRQLQPKPRDDRPPSAVRLNRSTHALVLVMAMLSPFFLRHSAAPLPLLVEMPFRLRCLHSSTCITPSERPPNRL